MGFRQKTQASVAVEISRTKGQGTQNQKGKEKEARKKISPFRDTALADTATVCGRWCVIKKSAKL